MYVCNHYNITSFTHLASQPSPYFHSTLRLEEIIEVGMKIGTRYVGTRYHFIQLCTHVSPKAFEIVVVVSSTVIGTLVLCLAMTLFVTAMRFGCGSSSTPPWYRQLSPVHPRLIWPVNSSLTWILKNSLVVSRGGLGQPMVLAM